HRWWQGMVAPRLSAAGTGSGKASGVVTTFLWVTLLWVPFRADSFSSALSVLAKCFTFDGVGDPLIDAPVLILVMFGVAAHVAFWKFPLADHLQKVNSRLFFATSAAAFAFAIALAKSTYIPFIYFQF